MIVLLIGVVAYMMMDKNNKLEGEVNRQQTGEPDIMPERKREPGMTIE